jgi:hypothetical protein
MEAQVVVIIVDVYIIIFSIVNRVFIIADVIM